MNKNELGQRSMNEGELRLTKTEIHWQKNSKTKRQKYDKNNRKDSDGF